MINFKHIDASSMEHALSVLAQYGEGARVLAGGQDLLFRIKKYIVKPECVVNIKTIPGLSYVRSNSQENLRIGALTTLSQVAQSSELQQRYSVLAQAAGVVASPQIRNMGTMAGNICQDVWCWYRRTDSPVGNPVASFATWQAATAATGSVSGRPPLPSNHPSDTAVALAALDAQVHVTSPRGKLTMTITDFLPGHLGRWPAAISCSSSRRNRDGNRNPVSPDAQHLRQICPEKIPTRIASGSERGDSRRVLQRREDCSRRRCDFPYRSREAEDLLRNRQISEAAAAEAAEAALQLAKPLKMNGYKVELSKTLVRRALLSLADQKTLN